MRVFKLWLPVTLWMGLIFVMSTDVGSATQTSRIIEPLVLWIKPNASQEQFELVHFLVRKLGHLSEYAVLALLLLRAIRRSQCSTSHKWSWRAAGFALLVAAAYAATDEWHQSFIPGRTAALTDVLIDSSGALIGLALGFFWQMLPSLGLYSRTLPSASTQASS
jgi:VanZ family protein